MSPFVRLAPTLLPPARKAQTGLLPFLMESSLGNRKTVQRFFKNRSLAPDDFLDDWLAILKHWSFNAATPGDLRRNHNISARTSESFLKLQNLGLSMKLDRAWLQGINRNKVV